jgi:signal transduction histidine kinase
MASKSIAGAAAGAAPTEPAQERQEPKHKYAQAIAFAIPFFLGVAVLWVFLRSDLDRQYDQIAQQASSQLNSLAETGASELKSKILAVDLLLRDLRDRVAEDSDAEFQARTEREFEQLGVSPTKMSARVRVVDATGTVRMGDPFSNGEKSPLLALLASQVAGQDQLMIAGYVNKGSLQQRRVIFARPLKTKGRGLKSMVMFSVDSRFLSTQKNATPLSNGKAITVTNIAGDILWSSAESAGKLSAAALASQAQEGKLLVAVAKTGVPPSDAIAAKGLASNTSEGQESNQVSGRVNRQGTGFALSKSSSAARPENGMIPGLIRLGAAADGEEKFYAWQVSDDRDLFLFVGQSSRIALQPYITLRARYGLFGIALSLLLIASLYWFFAFRHAAEQSQIKQEEALDLLKKSEKELSASRQSLRRLATHQMTLKEDERKRIALEIHDELGQRLTALRLEVAMAERRLATESDLSAIGALSNIKAQIDQVLEIVRNVATRLRPATLDISLGSAVIGLLEEFRKMTDITVEFHNQLPEDFHLGEPGNTTVFRILQESLTNVARHAQARRLELSLSVQKDCLLMGIVDDGAGFDMTQSKGRASMGLSGMRERAMALGGSVEISSAPDQSTRINVSVPLSKTSESSLQFVSQTDPLSDFRSE